MDRSRDIGEYLNYKNCKCRPRIAGGLAEECSKNIEENKMIFKTFVVLAHYALYCLPYF